MNPSSSTLDGAFFWRELEVDEVEEESSEVFISELGEIPPVVPELVPLAITKWLL